MNEYGTADSSRFSTACTIHQLKIIDPLYFQDPVLCSVFWCIPTWKANKFHQTAACHSVLLPQAFRRKLLEAKPYAIEVAGQIFYLLYGNWRAQSLDLRSLFLFFFFKGQPSIVCDLNCQNFSFNIFRVLLHACSSLLYGPFFAIFRPQEVTFEANFDLNRNNIESQTPLYIDYRFFRPLGRANNKLFHLISLEQHPATHCQASRRRQQTKSSTQ